MSVKYRKNKCLDAIYGRRNLTMIIKKYHQIAISDFNNVFNEQCIRYIHRTRASKE